MKINDYTLRNLESFPDECALLNKNYKAIIDALKSKSKASVKTDMADDIISQINFFENRHAKRNANFEFKDIVCELKAEKYQDGSSIMIRRSVSILNDDSSSEDLGNVILTLLSEGFSCSVDLDFTYTFSTNTYVYSETVQKRRGASGMHKIKSAKFEKTIEELCS